MENASKALLIAGGILIAIITMSLIVLVFNSISGVAEEQDRKLETEQLQTFNKSYEAYDKTRMYGTDVITVINKAMYYNGGLIPNDENEPIDIKLVINQNFATTTVKEKTYSNGDKEIGDPVPTDGTVELSAGEYSLLGSNGTAMNADMVSFFNETPLEDEVESERDGNTIVVTYTYSALSNFKRAIFECTGIDYSEENGRVNYMEFRQIDPDEE